MSSNTKIKVKSAFKIFIICTFIVMGIYVVQTIGYSFEKYVITSDKGFFNQFFTGTFGMLEWGFIIFIVVMISPPFRKFFFKWFNADLELQNLEKNVENQNKSSKLILSDREFQLELLKLQLNSDVLSSIFTVITSILLAILAVIFTLSITISDFVSQQALIVLISVPIVLLLAFTTGFWAVLVYVRNSKIEKLKQAVEKT